MRILRLAIISLAGLFILATVIGLLLPSVVLVSRATDVNAYRDSVMPHIKDINRWKLWIEGMNDTSVQVYSPVMAKLGRTEVSITGITDTTVISSWISSQANRQTSTIHLIGDPQNKMTIIQWQFVQKLPWYPWARLSSIMNDKILGAMMEKNLGHLKDIVEKPGGGSPSAP